MYVCMYVRLPEILRDDAGAQNLFVYVCVSKYVRMYIAYMYMRTVSQGLFVCASK
jgi:hypothetical protein